MKKNVIFTDMLPPKQWEFVQGMEERTELKWEVIPYVSNDRSSKLMEAVRYFKYFYCTFVIFIHRKKYDKIVAWQQFYGLLLAFYCRLFGVKKQFSLIVMTFIYKRKQGWMGNLYFLFVQFALNSKYIDKIIVFSQNEVNYYSNLFLKTDKFVCIPLGMENMTDLKIDKKLEQQKFILSVGRSNRDYKFLYEVLKDTEFKIKILANISYSPTDNIEIYTKIFGQDMFHYMNNCFCVVISLDDPKISSGQLVILQAMQLGKPIIVTESDGIVDYVENGYNGIIIKKKKEELIAALQDLYSNDNLYMRLSQNSMCEFGKKYSIRQLGNNVGDLLKKQVLYT